LSRFKIEAGYTAASIGRDIPGCSLLCLLQSSSETWFRGGIENQASIGPVNLDACKAGCATPAPWWLIDNHQEDRIEIITFDTSKAGCAAPLLRSASNTVNSQMGT
jgi:hypothetical protein